MPDKSKVDIAGWTLREATLSGGILVLTVDTPNGPRVFAQHSTESVEKIAGKVSPTGRFIGAMIMQMFATGKSPGAVDRASKATVRAASDMAVAEVTGEGDLNKLLGLLAGPDKTQTPAPVTPGPRTSTKKIAAPGVASAGTVPTSPPARSKGRVLEFRGRNSKDEKSR